MERGGAPVAARLRLKGDRMTESDTPERVAGGVAGKVAGRLKETAGRVIGDEDLAREGRLQNAEAEAEREAEQRSAEAREAESEAQLQAEKAATEAERDQLRTEVTERDREAEAEADRRRAENDAESRARAKATSAEATKGVRESVADTSERGAEQARIAEARDAVELERDARTAEARAEIIDPEEGG
jgi:uncharacterized protein YjbJ (UPF0337 family)